MASSGVHRPSAGPSLGRRSFLGALGATVLAACTGGNGDGTSAATTLPLVDVGADPFTLGVASGDPLAGSVILWTRLVDGDLPGEGVPVGWTIAADESLDDVVGSGTVMADGALGHAVHVEATDLEPDTTYWYRFAVGDFESPVGRTRTLPPPDSSPESLRFAVASCADYQQGWFTPYPHLADEDLAFVFFLGDYIYEEPAIGLPTEVREHEGGETVTLADYRQR
ncbi:MAG: PhoD-like phosphatase N-terminal domain-containing protein, partial [Actinomycetota bacterium]